MFEIVHDNQQAPTPKSGDQPFGLVVSRHINETERSPDLRRNKARVVDVGEPDEHHAILEQRVGVVGDL